MSKLNLYDADCEDYHPSDDGTVFCVRWDRKHLCCRSRKHFMCDTRGLPREPRMDQESDSEE